MFKKLYLLLAATCLIAVIINSCKKDAHTEQQNKISDPVIAQAKSWYESTYPAGSKLNTQTTAGNKDLSQLIKPDWQHTASYSRFNKQVIEMPIDPSVKFGSAMKNMQTGQITNQAHSRSSYILLNNGTGYDAYVMTLIADSTYLKGDLSKLTHNTYSKRDADYSGLVLYFTPNGKYVGGWRYKDGKIVTSGASQNGSTATKVQSTNGSKLKPDNIDVPSVDCTDWYWVTYDNGDPIEFEYMYTTCTGSGGGGGGGGGDNGPATPPSCPPGTSRTQSTSHLAVNNMPLPPPDDGGGFPPPAPLGPCVVVPATVINNVNNPCLRDVVDKLKAKGLSGKIADIIQDVFNSSDKVNITFQEFSDPNAKPAKSEIPTIDNGIYNETINLNLAQIKDASMEFKTIISVHEILHAYMNYNNQYFQQQFLQHKEIAKKYVDDIRGFVQQIYPSMDSNSANAIILNGIADVYPKGIKDDAYLTLLNSYGVTDALGNYELERAGVTGTPCPK